MNYLLILLPILGVVGFGAFLFIKNKKKKEKVNAEANSELEFTKLKKEESEIVDVVKDHLNIHDFEIYVYRDSVNWKRISDSFRLKTPPKAFAIISKQLIAISRFDLTQDIEIFTKLVIHELLHLKGHKHGDAMFKEEVKVTGEIFHKLNFR